MDTINGTLGRGKLSRYRSVRVKQQQQKAQEAVPPTTVTSSAITRSFSRYRHARSKPSDSSARQHSPAPLSNASQGLSSLASSPEKEDDIEVRRNRQEAMQRLMGESSSSSSRSRSRSASQGPARQEVNGTVMEQSKKASFEERMAGRSGEPVGYIEAGGGGVVAGIDAPLSAVSAGERAVRVQCQGSIVSLPVTGSTRAKDLLQAASNSLARGIGSETFILMESFTAFSLERPIRTYEHVREVVNSWVYDGDNFLFIVPVSSEEALRGLEPQEVSMKRAPAEATFDLYHCQRGGKWEKRLFTVRSDGQITMSAKTGRQQHTVCHLSDFDIYSIATLNLSRKERPPKPYAFAIKSQQKASMFLSTENFAHYFCTSDEATAHGFYRHVHRWRSWYLVNKLCTDGTEGPSNQDSHARKLGTLSSEVINDNDRVFHSRGTPGPSPQRRFGRERTSPRGDTAGDWFNDAGEGGGPFLSAGLLGRTYSQRQQVMHGRERGREKLNRHDPASPTTSSPHDLIRSMSQRRSRSRQPDSSPQSSESNTMRTSGNQTLPDVGGGLTRSGSVQRPPQKPLVDLTPVFEEPPQHSRKGKGHGVRVEPGVALVDVATGPELPPNAVVIPPATTWRRPQAPPAMPEHHINQREGDRGGYPSPQEQERGGLYRWQSRNHHHHHHYHYHHAPPAPPAPPSYYQHVHHGFLSRGEVPFRRNGVPKGNGVATGDRNARKPLLDMSDMNPFVEGSLLRNMKSKLKT